MWPIFDASAPRPARISSGYDQCAPVARARVTPATHGTLLAAHRPPALFRGRLFGCAHPPPSAHSCVAGSGRGLCRLEQHHEELHANSAGVKSSTPTAPAFPRCALFSRFFRLAASVGLERSGPARANRDLPQPPTGAPVTAGRTSDAPPGRDDGDGLRPPSCPPLSALFALLHRVRQGSGGRLAPAEEARTRRTTCAARALRVAATAAASERVGTANVRGLRGMPILARVAGSLVYRARRPREFAGLVRWSAYGPR